MAQVPVPAGPTVEAKPFSDVRFAVLDVSEGLRSVATGLGDASNAAGQASDTWAKVEASRDLAKAKAQDTADSDWLREQLWTGQDALYDKQGLSAADAAKTLAARMKERRDANLATLENDRQRKLYNDFATQRFGQEETGMARFAIANTHAEEDRQSASRIATASNDYVLNADDPVKRETAKQIALTETRSQAMHQGWGADTLKRAEGDLLSSLAGRVVKAKVDKGDYEGASAELEAHRDLMDANMQGALDAILLDPMLDRQAMGVVDDIRGTSAPVEGQVATSKATPAVIPRMVAITAATESNSRDRNPDGSIVTSRKGAQGSMQVMPGTNMDPGYGVTPAKDGSDAERARVGRDYLAALMKHYGNDPAKAWAAYNWGPGNFDAAMKAHPTDWMHHLPAETRSYVRGNLTALGGRGIGAPIRNQPQEPDLNKQLAMLDQMNLPYALRQRARQQLVQMAGTDSALLQQQRSKAEEQAWAAVEAKGPLGFTSISQIPADVRARMTAQQRLTFESIAARNIHKDGESSNWSAYSQYSDEYGADPGGFVQRHPPSELRAKLGDTEFKEVMGWRQSVLKSATGGTADQVTHARVNEITAPLLASAGIARPVEKQRGTQALGPLGRKLVDESGQPVTQDQQFWQRVGKFRQAVNADIDHWQRQNPGKKLDDNTIQQIADRQIMKTWQRDDAGNVAAKPVFNFERKAANFQYQIPVADRQQIIAAYKQRWGRVPYESEVSDIWLYGPKGGRQ